MVLTQVSKVKTTHSMARVAGKMGNQNLPRYFYSGRDGNGNMNYESSGFYDQRTMDKMFQEFMKRAAEEENKRKQAYHSRQKQNSRHQYQAYRGPGRDGEGYGAHDPFGDFFKSDSEPSYKQDYERAKAEERRQRAEEYERMQREAEENAKQAMRDWQEAAAKASESFEIGRRIAEKDGVIKGVISGFKSFFKK